MPRIPFYALFFAFSLSTVFAVGPMPRVLFGEGGAHDMAAIQPTGASVAAQSGELRITGKSNSAERGVIFRLPQEDGDLSAWRYVEARVVNRGSKPVTFTFWAMSGQGWGGVSTYGHTHDPSGREKLAPGASTIIRIDLHASYPGRSTPAINPSAVRWLEFIFEGATDPLDFSVGEVRALGQGLPVPSAVAARVRVPPAETGVPLPGKRVYRHLPGWSGTEVKHVITLPSEWEPGKKYPIIVEYPGSRFYHKFCYSTGRTGDANYGYGLAHGKDYIVLNLPFVSLDGKTEQVAGWGDIDRAVAYCLEAVDDTVTNFGGDRAAIIFTGFSRGSYAANYLALRNDRIAGLWSGFISPENPGKPWSRADMGWSNVGVGWNERAARLQAPWFFASAGYGPGVHVDGDFLEDSPSAKATRDWLKAMVRRNTP